MSLTPEIIRERTINGDISKNNALELLTTLIDNSEDEFLRLKCIHALQKLNVNNKNIYNLLENLLVSDENEDIRSYAGKALILNFSEIDLKPILWAIENESSYRCLASLFESLGKTDNYNFHKVILSFILNLLQRRIKKRDSHL